MKQMFCIKRKVSDLDLLAFNMTIRQIEENMTKIPEYITKCLHLGKYDYKFENYYDGMTHTHTVRCFYKFNNEATNEDIKFMESLKIDEFGNMEGRR